MSGLKMIGRMLSAFLWRVSLFALGLIAAFLAVFGSPEPLKQALDQSGVYGSIVDTVIQESQKQKSSENIPLERPEIQAAAKAAFPPEFIKTNTESVIDSTYDWLNKKTMRPEFRIDLATPKQAFIHSLGDYAVQRAEKLPACTLQELRQLETTADPFNIPCVPPGVEAERLREQVTTQVNAQEEFLKEPVITADNLQQDTQGVSPFEQANNAPEAFGWAKRAPILLIAVLVLSAAGLILTHDNRRRGMRIVAMGLLISGVIFLVFSWLLGYLFEQAILTRTTQTPSVSNAFQDTALSVISSLSNVYAKCLLVTGGIYAALGAVIWIMLKRTEPPVAESLEDKLITTNESAPSRQHDSPTGTMQ